MEEYRPKYLARRKKYIAPIRIISPPCRPSGTNGAISAWSCRPCSERSREVKLYEELALLLTTSGSTGSRSFVRLSYKNLSSNAASIASYLELTRSERPVTTLPMNYTYGLSVINSHALAGAAVLLTEKTVFDREFWEFASAEKATSLAGVPYTYEMLKKLKFMEMELPNLKTMTQAGGKLSVSLHREFAEYAAGHGKRFIVMYGQTEATARMGYLPAGEALNRCGSMGIAIPGGKFRLTGEDGREIKEAGTTGELVYEGKNVMLGYAKTGATCQREMNAEGFFSPETWQDVMRQVFII
ncbi:MAG: AMP-binding protein [[Ruminococcus] lactaris]|uniref:AMP-binding protein n=1 Tax=[Ruminococcus] lactaris TaxID=46228 RepID=UPI00399FAF97